MLLTPSEWPKEGKTSGLCAPQLGLPGLPDIPIAVLVFAPIPAQRRARAFLFFPCLLPVKEVTPSDYLTAAGSRQGKQT